MAVAILDSNIYYYLSSLVDLKQQDIKNALDYLINRYNIQQFLLPLGIETEINKLLKRHQIDTLKSIFFSLQKPLKKCNIRNPLLFSLIKDFMFIHAGEADAIQQIIMLLSCSTLSEKQGLLRPLQFIFISNDTKAYNKLKKLQDYNNFTAIHWKQASKEIASNLSINLPPYY